MNPFLAGAPADLAAALERRNATIDVSWREGDRAFARANSPEGGLFARYSDDPADRALFEYETAVRARIPAGGPLRAPRVIEAGPGWRIEQAINTTGPWKERATAIDGAAAAAAEIPSIPLRPHAPGAEHRSRIANLVRIARATAGPIKISDLRAARRALATSDLPTVTCHRDYHRKNLLIDDTDGGIWVIDWERAAPGPLGLDMLRLWATLETPEHRERVFEYALEQVGRDRRASLERLRFGVAVAEASGLHAEQDPFDRDDANLARLLELIPTVRPKS